MSFPPPPPPPGGYRSNKSPGSDPRYNRQQPMQQQQQQQPTNMNGSRSTTPASRFAAPPGKPVIVSNNTDMNRTAAARPAPFSAPPPPPSRLNNAIGAAANIAQPTQAANAPMASKFPPPPSNSSRPIRPPPPPQQTASTTSTSMQTTASFSSIPPPQQQPNNSGNLTPPGSASLLGTLTPGGTTHSSQQQQTQQQYQSNFSRPGSNVRMPPPPPPPQHNRVGPPSPPKFQQQQQFTPPQQQQSTSNYGYRGQQPHLPPPTENRAASGSSNVISDNSNRSGSTYPSVATTPSRPSYGHPPPPPPQQQQQQQQQQNGMAYNDPTAFQRHAPPPPPQYSAVMNNSGVDAHVQPTSGYPPAAAAASGLDGSTRRAYPQPQQQQQQPRYEEKPRIDPSQIPRPPLFTRPQQDEGYLPIVYPKQHHPPPPADSRYTVQDDGNASPDCIRCSVHAFPRDRGLWHKTGDIPLGILCTPMNNHSQDYTPRPRKLPDKSTQEWKDPQAVPVIGPSAQLEGSPPRCGHCHAYVNPYFGTDGTCNLCGGKNRHLYNITGLPMQLGTVEYDVSGPYITREKGPVQPITLYALDLTSPFVADYIDILEQIGVDMASHYEKQKQYNMTGPQPASPRIGICFVSCLGVIVHDVKQKQYNVMVDIIEEPFAHVPLIEWTFDLSNELESYQEYVQVQMEQDIAEWRVKTTNYKNSRTGNYGSELSCGGAALQFLADALAESGGRGTYIGSRRPNHGVGNLPHREIKQGDDSACMPLQLLKDYRNQEESDAAKFYKNLAMNCTKNRVALDIIMHTRNTTPQPPLDLATLGELCNSSCGKLSWITTHDWQESLYEELTRQIQTFSGWDAVFKLRCSNGIQVKDYHYCNGNIVDTFATGGSPEVELSVITSNTCVAIELDYRVGGIPKDHNQIYLQSALLFTSPTTGKRRVRVSTLAIPTTSVANDAYRSVDFSAMISLLTRSAIDCIRKLPSEGEKTSQQLKARDLVYHKSVLMLACYRQHTPAMNSPLGQLILPERMQLLPLFAMCLLKSPMLRPALPRRIPGMQASFCAPTADERSYYIWHAGHATSVFAMLMVHPNVFSVKNLIESYGQWQGPDEVGHVNGFIRMPPTNGPSMESLDDDGIYLIDDGLRIFLYIGQSTSDELKQCLMDGEPSNSAIEQNIEALVYQMRVYSSTTRGYESELRPTFAPIIRILQQEGHQSPVENDILNLMVADATSGEKDYVDFLCNLHRRIRQRIEGTSK